MNVEHHQGVSQPKTNSALLVIAATFTGMVVVGWAVIHFAGGNDSIASSQPAATRPYLEKIREFLSYSLPSGEWEEIEWGGTVTYPERHIPFTISPFTGDRKPVNKTRPAQTHARLRYRTQNELGAMVIMDQTFVFEHGSLPAITDVFESDAYLLPGWFDTGDGVKNNPPPMP